MKHILWRPIEIDDRSGIARFSLKSKLRIKKIIVEERPNEKVHFRRSKDDSRDSVDSADTDSATRRRADAEIRMDWPGSDGGDGV